MSTKYELFELRTDAKPVTCTTEGNCDLCGKWDGNLKGGVCDECVERYQPVDAKPVPS